MKTLSIRCIQLLLMMGCAQALAADFRVGIVNTERIMSESPPAVKAAKRIEKEFSARDQEIKKIAKQMKDIQALVEKEGLTLSEAEKRNKERELANLNVNLQRMQRTFSEDLNLRKNEELASILEHANKAIQAIAEKEKYDLILQEAVYRNVNIDITDKVLKYMLDNK
ncbi:MAG: OmpH family outer membrane protein [Candidatus Nitrotoga sp.]|nr:OmpH family outer membrane protein [Candidatus Nitrotoga sp.]MDW7625275.1 OmpH family outer membrane protein [Candidatus Nitrotoga sp.]